MSASPGHQRAGVLAGLALLLLLSWWYLIGMAGGMAAMPAEHMAMAMPISWNLQAVLLLLAMWMVMMVAMMLPSAIPMIMSFLTVNHRRHAIHGSRAAYGSVVPSYVFVSAYLLVWMGFSVLATALQWFLHEYALINIGMASIHLWLSAGVLVGAGLFQLMPLKRTCLRHCRSPLSFLMSQWREGYGGAFHMGLRHGLYCVGCCWALMLLLFVGGVMNLFVVIAIAIFVLLEKLLPVGVGFACASGGLMILAGLSWLVLGG